MPEDNRLPLLMVMVAEATPLPQPYKKLERIRFDCRYCGESFWYPYLLLVKICVNCPEAALAPVCASRCLNQMLADPERTARYRQTQLIGAPEVRTELEAWLEAHQIASE